MKKKWIARRDFLRALGVCAGAAAVLSTDIASAKRRATPGFLKRRGPRFNPRNRMNEVFPIPRRPNVLLITADDMAWDSLGVNGCTAPLSTPHLDRLAAEGIRFDHAHVNIAVCQPCRGTLATGRYPHRSGIEGFEHTRMRIPTIMQTLKDAGYLTGIFSKVDHSTPHAGFVWDLKVRSVDTCNGRDPERYHDHAVRFIERAQAEGRPFYLMANSEDPHRPFDGAEHGKKRFLLCDPPAPSRRYRQDEVPVPGFLPDLPPVRKEIAQYFGSVRRTDDTVGELLRALDECGAADDTLVIFISDHGMSFPFSKATCYPQGTRIPWVMRWPKVIHPGMVNRDHFISAIDFMPTILEAVGLSIPGGMDGTSFMPLLKGENMSGRDRVFTQFYRTSHEGVYPARAVQDKDHCYIFNPWADGRRQFVAESMRGITFTAMRKAAKTDSGIAARLRMYVYRAKEELYDLRTDPNCLVNLAENPAYTDMLATQRGVLGNWMKDTVDPALAAFNQPTNKRACQKLVRMTARGRRRIHIATK